MSHAWASVMNRTRMLKWALMLLLFRRAPQFHFFRNVHLTGQLSILSYSKVPCMDIVVAGSRFPVDRIGN